MLSSKRIARLRAALLEERASLQDQIARLVATSYEAHLGLGNHMADDGTDAFEQAATASLRRGKERVLAEIEDALRRMEDGTYGRCQRCHEEIDFARLKAIPYARLCMACQKAVEL